MGIKINIGEETREKVRKNLLRAQGRIADTGSARDNVMIAKFLFKLSEKFDSKVKEVGFVESENSTSEPPN